MPSVYDNYKRDGMDKLLSLGKALCALVISFAPIIRGKFADSVAIMALLVAVENLCPLISDAEAEFLAFAPDDPVPPDPDSAPVGVDASAPPAGDPTGII